MAITHLAIGTDSQVTHHTAAMENVAEQHILTKCFKYNTFGSGEQTNEQNCMP